MSKRILRSINRIDEISLYDIKQRYKRTYLFINIYWDRLSFNRFIWNSLNMIMHNNSLRRNKIQVIYEFTCCAYILLCVCVWVLFRTLFTFFLDIEEPGHALDHSVSFTVHGYDDEEKKRKGNLPQMEVVNYSILRQK